MKTILLLSLYFIVQFNDLSLAYNDDIFNFNNRISLNQELKSLSDRYGDIFFLALLSLEETQEIYNVLDIQIDWINYQEKINSMNLSTKSYLIEELAKKYDKIDNHNILLTIENWCKTYHILTQPFLVEDKNLIVEEIISEHPMSDFLLKKYIKVQGQSWYSLSFRQSNEYFYESLNYVSGLPLVKKLEYYQQYFKICQEKLLSK